MLANILIWLGLVLAAGLLFWLARRALRLRNPVARWPLALLATLPALLVSLIVGLIGLGYAKLYLPRTATPMALDTAAAPELIARGEHLARTTCVACHTTNNELPLSGGVDLGTHSPMPIGVIVPPNLTPAGPLKDWTDLEIAQAIRNGRHKDGRVLLMPTESLRNLSDEDVSALVAFLRSQPPVHNETPDLNASPLLAAVFGVGLAELGVPPVAGSVTAPPKQPDATYGAYVISYQDCQSCHGADLNGSQGGLGPAAPSIPGIVRTWTLEQFIQTMRTGVDPTGHTIQEPMPWRMLGKMDDVELTALYYYLRGEK
jgi:mono/diheme cytochrome c family protein